MVDERMGGQRIGVAGADKRMVDERMVADEGQMGVRHRMQTGMRTRGGLSVYLMTSDDPLIRYAEGNPLTTYPLVDWGWLLLLGCVLLAGTTYMPHLISLFHHNRGELDRIKIEVDPSRERTAVVPRAYERAMAADPGNFLPYLGYGQWMLGQGDPVQAAGRLKRAVALNPTHGPARFYLGLAYLEQERFEDAAAQWRRSDVLPGYLVHRAWQHVERTRQQPPENQDWTAAERYYRAAVALSPDDLTLWGYLAEFYVLWPRDHARARASWREAARMMPASPVPHQRAAESLWRQWQDAAGAVAELEEAVRRAPADVEPYLFAAEILRQVQDEAAAEAWLRRATGAAPASGEAHFRLGELYLDQERTPHAIQALRGAVAAAPAVARYQARLGEALSAMGLLAEAIQAVEAAVNLEPAEPAYLRWLGGLYREAGNSERALAAYQRVLELVPEDPQVRAALRALTDTADVVSFVTADGVTLSGTLYGAGASGVIFAHTANADQTRWEAVAREVAGLGYLVLTFDFRAHGKSQGAYDATRSPDDLRAAVAFLRGQGAQHVALVGASLGGMATARVAADVKPAAVVIISAPAEFGGLVVGDEDLAAIGAPALLITTESDWATASTLHMFEAIPAPKDKAIYAGNAHGTDMFDTEYGAELKRRIVEFLRRHFPANKEE